MWLIGDGRNSYSKTDENATFMRMKEDHMRNGQLKPGYHVQIGVNSEYITGIEVFSDRSDVKTLKPFLRRLEGFHRARYEDVVADAGYESLENDLYLDATGQACFIKPTNYDQKKSKKFQKQTGRIENTTYQSSPNSCACTRPFGKSGLRPHNASPSKGAFICACAAPFRWKGPSPC